VCVCVDFVMCGRLCALIDLCVVFGRSTLSRKGMLSLARELNFYTPLGGFSASEVQWRRNKVWIHSNPVQGVRSLLL
jgi:hypothetical protein